MRKIIKLSVFAFLSIAMFACGIVTQNQKNVYAETIDVPTYFSVKKTDNTTVASGGSAFISAGDTLSITLNRAGTVNISDITPHILLNGKELSNVDIKNMINNETTDYAIIEHEVAGEGTGNYYFNFEISGTKIFNNMRSDGSNLYGKFEISFEYHESVNSAIVNRDFSYNFYLLKSDDYNLNKYKIINAENSGASLVYNNEYTYLYEDEQMPKLVYDAKYFDVSITKNAVAGNAQNLNIAYRGTDLNIASDVAYVTNDGSKVTIVFNSLANYTINYKYIHLDNSVAVNLKDGGASLELEAHDKLTIDGYTLTYTDTSSTSGKRNEFKEISSAGIIGKQRTDFTYLMKGETGDEQTLIGTFLEKINTYLSNNSISLCSTNQAPLQIVLTKDVDLTKSRIVKLKNSDAGLELLNASDLDDLTDNAIENEYFTRAGKYLLKLQSKDETPHIQWFAFEITSTIPSFSVNRVDRASGEINDILSTGAYTNQKVQVGYSVRPSIFDAPTTLTVSQYAYDKTSLIRQTTISANQLNNIFTENGYYKVNLKYGVNSYSDATFTIDTMAISDYSSFNVLPIGNSKFAKVSDAGFLTNQPISVYWSNKESGAVVECEYKYFALQSIQANYLDYFNQSNYLKSFYLYNNYSVPILSQINYREDSITTQLIKPSNSSYINSASVLSDAGLYIFRLYDTSGQEKLFAVVIDNTSPVILQENVDHQFVEVKDLNSVSNDTTIYWGKQKIIKMDELVSLSEDNNKWLKCLKDNYGDYFAPYTLRSSTDYYLEVPMSEIVYQSIGGASAMQVPASSIVQYGTKIEFLSGGKANERDYTFYFRDASNSKNGSNPVESYTDYSSAIHSLKVTSDASRTEIYYNNKDGKPTNLVLASYYDDSQTSQEGYSLKKQYYQPTNKLTFSGDKVLYLDFLAKPVVGAVEVGELSCDYYPFETKVINNFSYKQYSADAQHFDIYKVNEGNSVVKNETTISEDKLKWKVNTYYDNNLGEEITKEGKYVVTRTYRILSNTIETTNTNYDYITRKMTFYVDRNSIISAPEVVSSDKVQSVVGGGIKIKITNSFFTEAYIAQNYASRSNKATSTHEGSITSILKTNKFPINLYVPYYKYGYETIINSAPTFIPVNAEYFDENNANLITYNTLKASIYKYSTANDIENPAVTGTVIYTSTAPEQKNGYIVLPEITENGYYEVIISENDPNAPQYVFVFLVSNDAPEFTITDDTNLEYENINFITGQKYFTNKDIIRVSWQDPASTYMAKIDQNELSYYFTFKDGTTSSVYKISKSAVVTDPENTSKHYAQIDLTAFQDINTNNISSVMVTAYYEGYENFSVNYSTTKEIVIDKIAPAESIAELLNASTLSSYASQIRDNSQGKFNVTKKDGLFRNFAFTVDKSQINSLIKINKITGTDAYKLWYRHVDKYKVGHHEETDPNGFVASNSYHELDANALTTLNANSYYEIIEGDLAGNLTVYTIYVTDFAHELADKTIIEWTTPVKTAKQIIKTSDYSANIELYSKRSFEISKISLFKNSSNNGYPWYVLSVNGINYFHSPYTSDNVLSTLDGSTYNLSDITKLSIKDSMQTIMLLNAPVYKTVTFKVGVLSENKTLNYLHFSELDSAMLGADGYYNFVNTDGTIIKAKEGIIIEIPQASNKANIYATAVNVIYDDDYQLKLTTPLSSSTALEGVEGTANVLIKSYIAGGKTYAIVYVDEPVKNKYYIYQLEDNFGQKYPPKTFIYGEEEVAEAFTSSVDIQQQQIDNKEYFYSTNDISFEFNINKNYIVFSIDTDEGTINVSTKDTANYVSVLQQHNIRLVPTVYENSRPIAYKVTLKAEELSNVENGIAGGRRVYNIKIFTNISIAVEGFNNEGRDCTFVINNTIPEINLFGKNNENLNDIINNERMIVGGPITIKYVDTVASEFPNIVYLENLTEGTTTLISSGHVVTKPAQYRIIILYDNSTIFAGAQYGKTFNFRISDDAVEFYMVYVADAENQNRIVKETGNPFEYTTIDNEKRTIYSHYIVNSGYEILCNQGQKITATKMNNPSLTKTDVYKISNYGESASGYNLNYYEKLIAVTKIKKTNSIIDKFSYIEPEGTPTTLYDKLATEVGANKENHTVVMEKGSMYEPVAKYSWNSYYSVKENIVSVQVLDENNHIKTPRIETIANISYMYIDKSGNYKIMFTDLAGNKQLFNASDSFEVTYLSSVIFNVNGKGPINNAIYDNSQPVVVSIPTSTKSLYDNRTTPVIHVEKNGELFTPESSNKSTVFTFTQSGLYKIWFSATVGGKEVREDAYYFTIINKNETRWAYELVEHANYYIDKIKRNGVDITDQLALNPLIGKTILVPYQTENGTVEKLRLKNLMVSLYDEQTGAGRYELSVKTNDINNETFTFEFWINNANPPIEISLEEGETTTKDITVRFSKSNIYDSVGDCYVKINGYNDLFINLETLAEGKDVINVQLKQPDTYYIQIYSESGNLLYSYRVNKQAPLNAISIILIVVGSIAFIGIVVMFVLLRKRMKIR